ncbi:MAG: OmpA family protein [Candidatus Omnitrophica bacterium]|nr:OmpA family protein [Candidatus Omnitrophota bacterium]
MRRSAILLTSFLMMAGCQCAKEDGLVRQSDDPYGSTVNAPFTAMAENAYQPDPVLGRVYFEYDKADLSDVAKSQLAEIAKLTARRAGLVVVEGHADHMNTDPYNIRLGYQRALTAADYLRSEGVWDERIVIRSYGEERPASTNWKDLGRALNRCVVVHMYVQGEGMPAQESTKTMADVYKKSGASDEGSKTIGAIELK